MKLTYFTLAIILNVSSFSYAQKCKLPKTIYREYNLNEEALIEIKDLMIGKHSLVVNSKIITLASKVAYNNLIMDYIRCQAKNRDKVSNEQYDYLSRSSHFLSTSPTPEQYLEWEKLNKPSYKDTIPNRHISEEDIKRIETQIPKEYSVSLSFIDNKECEVYAMEIIDTLNKLGYVVQINKGMMIVLPSPPDNKRFVIKVDNIKHEVKIYVLIKE